ncbi:MAG: type II secretion system F family protein [Acidobacteriaceae bacterium]
MSTGLLLATAMTIFSLCALVVVLLLSRSSDPLKRVLYAKPSTLLQEQRSNALHRLEGAVVGLTVSVGRRVGFSANEKLQQRLRMAGRKGAAARDLFMAVRLLGPVAAILGGSFIPQNTFFWVMALAVAAYLAPEIWLDHLVRQRRERIRKSVPDVVDLLVICVDAGLGLDQALLRVAQELGTTYGEISEELLQVNREQRAGMPRLEAWKKMTERNKVPDLESLTSMLVQAERFGTPITVALTNFANVVRVKRRQRAEEMAAKTTVKIIFPLVIFIFPTMLIVLVGPAMLTLTKAFTELMK